MNRIEAASLKVACVVAGVLLTVQSAFAQTASYRQLSTEWWQWALSIPAAENPLSDATGAKCMTGQRGSTWFLAGTFSGDQVTRSCDVPEGSTLFFPVLNSVGFDTPSQCGQGPTPLPASFYRAGAAAFIDSATNLSVTLDGQAVTTLHRTVSAVFDVALPTDNLFAGFCDPPLAAGVYSPAIDDGYYVRLNPLALGPHTLNIRAESSGFAIDVTYNLVIVPLLTD